jgi:hypothetical protein
MPDQENRKDAMSAFAFIGARMDRDCGAHPETHIPLTEEQVAQKTS